MSEATTKALIDIMYDAFVETPDVRGLDNEQVYNLARTAAETIESAGTTKAIIRAWLEEKGISENLLMLVVETGVRPSDVPNLRRWARAIKAVSS